ncbi:MAG: MBL fold metallo-hydrolase [Chloroflexi bacterium]|nr:MBL fold metallo-hydrolase [Chloroflexota bacterium]
MFIKQIQIESLGNSSYLVGSEEEKVCAVIDPVRDVDIYIREAEALGVRILYSLETHVHNDFISGSRELAARIGATVCSSSAGGLVFDHRPLNEGDTIEMGEVKIEVIATPGHTPEHISFLVTDTMKVNGPHAMFSGGALLVGGVARSDLLGKELAPFLGRWFYQTIKHKLQGLNDDVAVYPTHGGGSFCLATPSGSGATTTTIGQERAGNPFFQAATESEFLELALGDLPPIPRYYGRMANINVRGPRILGGLPSIYPLAPREVWVRIQKDSAAIDIRPPEEYAALHIPRSYSVPFGGSAGTWVGWLVEESKPIILVSDNASARDEMVRQLIRIGYDSIEGYLEGGMEAWENARLPVSHLQTITPEELYPQLEGGGGPQPLDVRFGYEWRVGHVPNALHIELGDLPEQASTLSKDKAYALFCAAGVRASTAASILKREGINDVTLVVGGTSAWENAGYPLEKDDS